MDDELRTALAEVRSIIDKYRYGNCADDEYSIATPQNQAVWIMRRLAQLGWQPPTAPASDGEEGE